MLAVVQGQEHDRIPFAMYEIVIPPQQAFDLLSHGRIGILRSRRIYRVEHPHCMWESEFFVDREIKWQRNISHTPKGNLTELRIFEPVFDSSTARKHFNHNRNDYKILWSYLEDSIVLELLQRRARQIFEVARRLWVNFPSSVHLASPDVIRATADEILVAAGHTGRLQIQVSENVPLDVWQVSYPIIVEDIESFGVP